MPYNAVYLTPATQEAVVYALEPITLMTLTQLEQNYKERRAEKESDRYALEIFRRAIEFQDHQAWGVLDRSFSALVRTWLRRHPQREIAYALDSEENYVAGSFTRLWRASLNNPNLTFSTLAAALDYLRASLNGTIMDTIRAYRRPNQVALPDPADANYSGEIALELDDLRESDESAELWVVLCQLLKDPHELRLAYLHFHCGLKAREIIQFCPGEFRDVQEVYRLRHNIFKRLLRNADQIRWRLGLDV